MVLGVISPLRFVLYCIAQLVGAIAASAVLRGLLPGSLRVVCSPSQGMGTAQALFLGRSCFGSPRPFPDTRILIPHNCHVTLVFCSLLFLLLPEMFLTFGLCLTVVMIAVEKNKTTAIAPLPIGVALFSTQLAGIAFTGAAVNTGRLHRRITPSCCR